MDQTPPQSEGDQQGAPSSPKPIRVGWIAGNQAAGSLARAYQPLVIGLMDELVEVVLFHPRGAGDELSAGVSETATFPMPGLWGCRRSAVRAMAEDVSGRKIDLLHALDAGVARLARKVSKVAGIRYLVSSHGVGDAGRMRKLPDRAGGILASSTPISEAIAAGSIVDPERLSVVRPGVHCVHHPTCFDESDRSIAIVAGGREERNDAFEAILRTFAELKERRFDCVFFVICADRTESRIRQTAEKLKLTDSLTFVDPGPQTQFTGIIKAADIYISAGPPDHLDLHALLAMGAGSVVLSPPDPSADFIIDAQTALLYKAGCTEELTTKVVSLLDDPSAARALARSALSHVSSHHSPAKIVAETAALYRRTMST